jgi:hypothetical protein
MSISSRPNDVSAIGKQIWTFLFLSSGKVRLSRVPNSLLFDCHYISIHFHPLSHWLFPSNPSVNFGLYPHFWKVLFVPRHPPPSQSQQKASQVPIPQQGVASPPKFGQLPAIWKKKMIRSISICKSDDHLPPWTIIPKIATESSGGQQFS